MRSFEAFFKAATGFSPYPYQRRLADVGMWPDLLEIPTGAGKTDAIVLAWMWRRYVGRPDPRRLVYTLPMRGLVEQTYQRVSVMIDRMADTLGDGLPFIDKLLGGEVGEEWFSAPEQPMILIGTQDLILSRALNRGYAMNRFKWPMAFGVLNEDALWIIDEMQLQGVGVTTSAQLQALREKLGTFAPTATTFVSATVDRSWLVCADFHIDERLRRDGSVINLDADDRRDPRLARILDGKKTAYRDSAFAVADVAATVRRHHRPGTRTLVILNQVGRARDVAAALMRGSSQPPVRLLHSRFRPDDRTQQIEACFGKDAPAEAIIVATQVVEAGIDTSATTMISDLAPWASIVQRLGRCNRRGDDDDATFRWLDPGEEPSKASALPYDVSDLIDARTRLLAFEGRSVSPSDLPTDVPIRRERGATLRRVDLLDLFDTTADLSGNDVDVSRFIRVGDELNVYAMWRSDATDDRPGNRHELCPVPRSEMVKLLKRLGDAGRADHARVENPVAIRRRGERVWIPASRTALRIGEIVRLDANVGAYTPERGFDLESSGAVAPVFVMRRLEAADQTAGDDTLVAIGSAVTLWQHSTDAASFARVLVESLPLNPRLRNVVTTAARWHDAGKAHDVFQETLRNSLERSGVPADGGPWAKSVHAGGRHRRPHFRHEVGSALAWLVGHDADEDGDLVAYLIAAHHGKARVTLQTFPGERLEPRRILGVQEGDSVPSASLGDGINAPGFQVDLSLFDIGGYLRDDGSVKASWSDRVLSLRDSSDFGPFRLAFLETLVRVADWRASERSYDLEHMDADPLQYAVDDEPLAATP